MWLFCVGAFVGCGQETTDTNLNRGGVQTTDAQVASTPPTQPQQQTQPAPTTRRGVDPFCQTRPKIDFCEDFDTQELPGSFGEQITKSGELRLDETESASAPYSVMATVDADGEAAFVQRFEKGGKLRLFGMLYVSELGQGDVKIATFIVGDYTIGFGVSQDGSLWAFEGERRIEGMGTIPVGKWASFRWDVNLLNDGTSTAKLRFGNDFYVNADMLSPPTESNPPPEAKIGLYDATGAWSMRFDNLTLAVEEIGR